MSEIAEAIRILAKGDNTKVYSIEATVESVDLSARTCTCQAVSGTAHFELKDVRLMATIDDGMLLIPAIDSNVVVILSQEEPYISQYSELDKVVMMGGEYGGLVKVKELTQQINRLEDKMNSLITLFNTHTHVVPGGAASPVTTQESPLTKTLQKQLENIHITHG